MIFNRRVTDSTVSVLFKKDESTEAVLRSAVAGSHPNYTAIHAALTEGWSDDSTDTDAEFVLSLFDVKQTLERNLRPLSESISVGDDGVYINGVLDEGPLANQVWRWLNDGVGDWKPVVAFWERVLQNVNDHTRENLMRWLSAEEFSITPDGMIVAYKSVYRDGYEYLSANCGHAFVNGVEQNGRIRQSLGDTVSMPRDEVAHDPAAACHTGLHVGTWNYASTFSGDVKLEVHVDPEHVVSVPTDCESAKMRVEAYTIKAEVTEKHSLALVGAVESVESVEDDVNDEDYDYCPDCGEVDCDGLCDHDYYNCDEGCCN